MKLLKVHHLYSLFYGKLQGFCGFGTIFTSIFAAKYKSACVKISPRDAGKPASGSSNYQKINWIIKCAISVRFNVLHNTKIESTQQIGTTKARFVRD